ncbi:hypothetical protein CGRA01v4_00508 [Colletotrichum graminicola]|uniref:Uncharacterized protein n=1 Tax=Colletotrichum graminicola (strain M1.001 / M2 / FGSC 10212) TaxID=645133 RepID=E3QQ73_COLGM|nr:uncharacterized protein GLRG_08155 [Colletotrichum graminicola M1.001]EFQ33011.1 hypothetical protein GLRG_08155 [Colletotrichum graminicola M1.001]WDK09230.1 hypothetical protein CGRA01v4_00508 [Colletotrichum graminicola]
MHRRWIVMSRYFNIRVQGREGEVFKRYQRLNLPHRFVFRFYNGSQLFCVRNQFIKRMIYFSCACSSTAGSTKMSYFGIYVYLEVVPDIKTHC